MAIFTSVGGTPVSLNGITWTEVVGAPASAKQREILGLHINNLDTAPVTVRGEILLGGTEYEDFPEVTVPAGKRAQFLLAPVVLDATNMSFRMRLAVAQATTNPRVHRAVFEVP